MSDNGTIIVHCRCSKCDTCNHIACGYMQPITWDDIDKSKHVELGSAEFFSLPIEDLQLLSNQLPITCKTCSEIMPIGFIVVGAKASAEIDPTKLH